MKTGTFKNTTTLNYSASDIFKLFNKMAKQDFPRFNPKEALGCSTKKTIGHYAGRQAEAYVEITDYIDQKVYEVTTITSSTKLTFVSRYSLEKIDDNTTILTCEETQSGTGFFDTMNHTIQAIFFKKRIGKRFNLLVQSLEYSLNEMVSKRQPTNKDSINLNKVEESTPAIDKNSNDITLESASTENN